MRRIAVIGGGISGLAAALRLRDLSNERGAPVAITLYEPRERLGGCIQTWREEGLVLEAGADSLLAEKPAATRMLQRLGLTDDLVPIRPEYRGARILRGGRLRPLPEGFRFFSPRSTAALIGSGLFSPAGMARAALEPLIPARKSGDDESLASFVRRRFGGEVLDRLAQPLLAGIYSADPERLSMQVALPQFAEMERTHGSVMRGLSAQNGGATPRLMSLRGGLSRLVEALERELSGIERIREAVTDGESLRLLYDGVICAVPAYAAAKIVAAEQPKVASLLERIGYNSIATVTLLYRASEVPALPAAQGFIVPFAEKRRIVAATIVGQKYAERVPDGIVALRAFIGGGLQPELAALGDEELIGIARAEFKGLLGIAAAPARTLVAHMTRVLPEYGVGHGTLVDEIERLASAGGFFALAGAAYRGVGIPDCIASGEVAAERLLGTM